MTTDGIWGRTSKKLISKKINKNYTIAKERFKRKRAQNLQNN